MSVLGTCSDEHRCSDAGQAAYLHTNIDHVCTEGRPDTPFTQGNAPLLDVALDHLSPARGCKRAASAELWSQRRAVILHNVTEQVDLMFKAALLHRADIVLERASTGGIRRYCFDKVNIQVPSWCIPPRDTREASGRAT